MGVTRTHDLNLIGTAIQTLCPDMVDPIKWAHDPDNIALINDHGDLALFEKSIKNIYGGHYFFKSRGRQAIESGKEFLDNLFNTCYNIEVLLGLVPIGHLGARWLSRQLGFTSQGATHYGDKHYEMFIITKREFNDRE